MSNIYIHNFRKWAGHPFGSKPQINRFTGRNEPIEPFIGACGDCGKPENDHPIVIHRPETIMNLAENLYDALKAVQIALYEGEDENAVQIENALLGWEKRNIN